MEANYKDMRGGFRTFAQCKWILRKKEINTILCYKYCLLQTEGRDTQGQPRGKLDEEYIERVEESFMTMNIWILNFEVIHHIRKHWPERTKKKKLRRKLKTQSTKNSISTHESTQDETVLTRARGRLLPHSHLLPLRPSRKWSGCSR